MCFLCISLAESRGQGQGSGAETTRLAGSLSLVTNSEAAASSQSLAEAPASRKIPPPPPKQQQQSPRAPHASPSCAYQHPRSSAAPHQHGAAAGCRAEPARLRVSQRSRGGVNEALLIQRDGKSEQRSAAACRLPRSFAAGRCREATGGGTAALPRVRVHKPQP